MPPSLWSLNSGPEGLRFLPILFPPRGRRVSFQLSTVFLFEIWPKEYGLQGTWHSYIGPAAGQWACELDFPGLSVANLEANQTNPTVYGGMCPLAASLPLSGVIDNRDICLHALSLLPTWLREMQDCHNQMEWPTWLPRASLAAGQNSAPPETSATGSALVNPQTLPEILGGERGMGTACCSRQRVGTVTAWLIHNTQ